jgi:cobalt-zinc-cadmium efflux system protein
MHERDHAREVGAVRVGLGATALLCVAELIGGWLTNSLALLTDAVHMLSDVAALGLSLFALWVCARPASVTKTFGYYRAEILAALVNGVVLWVIVVFIGFEAWRRVFHPPVVAGGGMFAVATAGLLVNVFVARRLREHRHHSLNMRGAYLHVLSDLLGSVGAMVAGAVILLTGWTPADAVASALIATLILFGSWALVREAVDVLMEAVPAHVDVDALRRALLEVPGTEEVHDLHVWSLTTGRYALSAHAVVPECEPGNGGGHGDDQILAAMAEVCARQFRIEHVTIQIEHESRRAAEPVH